LIGDYEARDSPTLSDYLVLLRRRKWLVISVLVLVPAVAIGLSLKSAPTYSASAQLLLNSQTQSFTGTQTQSSDPARAAQTEAQLARVPDVAQKAIDAVGASDLTTKQFLKSSSVKAGFGSDFLTFSVIDGDPDRAIRLATAYANAFSTYRQDLQTQDVQSTVAAVHKQINQLEASGLTDTKLYRSLVAFSQRSWRWFLQPSDALVVQKADEATKVGPQTVRNGVIAFVLGLVLALGLAFLRDALDSRVRSVDKFREGLGLRLLGNIPRPSKKLRGAGLVMLAAPTSHDADQFRLLRVGVDLANRDHQARTIMVTSPVGGEGKSTTVANLAVALARVGHHVVLVDFDLRRPNLHRLFELGDPPGLTDVELGDVALEDALRPITLPALDTTPRNGSRAGARVGKLEVLPAGHALQDPDLLGEQPAAGIFQNLRGRADLVLIDSAPLLPSGDAIALSAQVDAMILVVRLDTLRKSAFDNLRRTLASSPAAKLGFVLADAEMADVYGPALQRYPTTLPDRLAAAPNPKMAVLTSRESGPTAVATASDPSGTNGQDDVRSLPADDRSHGEHSPHRGHGPALAP